jgi:hypothetical protein
LGNSREALINVVITAKRKMLNRLDQKGAWSSPKAPNSAGAVVGPPAERRDLTHTVAATERRKPVVSPQEKAALAREVDEAAGNDSDDPLLSDTRTTRHDLVENVGFS